MNVLKNVKPYGLVAEAIAQGASGISPTKEVSIEEAQATMEAHIIFLEGEESQTACALTLAQVERDGIVLVEAKVKALRAAVVTAEKMYNANKRSAELSLASSTSAITRGELNDQAVQQLEEIYKITLSNSAISLEDDPNYSRAKSDLDNYLAQGSHLNSEIDSAQAKATAATKKLIFFRDLSARLFPVESEA